MRYYPYVDILPTEPPSTSVRVVSPGQFDVEIPAMIVMALPYGARAINVVGRMGPNIEVFMGQAVTDGKPVTPVPPQDFIPMAKIRVNWIQKNIRSEHICEY